MDDVKTLDAGSMYNGYTYSPSSSSGWDYASDLFLGTNKVQQNNQNKLNWEMMKEQNKFNEYMSNTSYQRAVRDMKAAGINPMLAASIGGASTPSSSNVSQSAPDSSTKAVGKKLNEMLSLGLKIASLLI